MTVNKTMTNPNKINTLIQLYKFLDDLFDQDVGADTLFASSYLRGFLSFSAGDFGNEEQQISVELVDKVNEQIAQAKAELSPQDSVIVNNFWLSIQDEFSL